MANDWPAFRRTVEKNHPPNSKGSDSSTAFCLRPVDAPAVTRQRHPKERLPWRAARMMVEVSSALIEPSGVRRVLETEPPVVQVMTEFMAQGA